MHELLLEQEEKAAATGEVVAEVTLRFRSGVQRDPRRYNRPTVDEAAMAFLDDDGGPPSNRDILVHPRNRKVLRISE